MASLIWRPTLPKETATVTVDDVVYTFLPGVARDVPPQHAAAIQTVLATTGAVTSGPPEI